MIIDLGDDMRRHPTWRLRWAQLAQWFGHEIPMERYLDERARVLKARAYAMVPPGCMLL